MQPTRLLSMGFPRQEYWRGLPFPSPADPSDLGIDTESPALAGGFFTSEPPGKPVASLPHPYFLLTGKGAEDAWSHLSQKTMSLNHLTCAKSFNFLLSNQSSLLSSRPAWPLPTNMPMVIPHAPQNQYVPCPPNLSLYWAPTSSQVPYLGNLGLLWTFLTFQKLSWLLRVESKVMNDSWAYYFYISNKFNFASLQ